MGSESSSISRREALQIIASSGVTIPGGVSLAGQATAKRDDITTQKTATADQPVGDKILECKERGWTGSCHDWYTEEIIAEVDMSVNFDPKLMAGNDFAIFGVDWTVTVPDDVPGTNTSVNYYVEKVRVEIRPGPDSPAVISSQPNNYFRENPDDQSGVGLVSEMIINIFDIIPPFVSNQNCNSGARVINNKYISNICKDNTLTHRPSRSEYESAGSLNIDVTLPDKKGESAPFEYTWIVDLELKLRQNIRHSNGESNYIYEFECGLGKNDDLVQKKSYDTTEND